MLDLELCWLLHITAHIVHTTLGEGWRLPALSIIHWTLPWPWHSLVLVRTL